MESILAKSLYGARGVEIKKYLEKLSEEYGGPEATHAEVRAMMDDLLGQRTLSGEVYRMREDQS